MRLANDCRASGGAGLNELFQAKWRKRNEARILQRGCWRSGVSRGCGGAPGEVAAFMAIASQRPIVGGLGGGSNLAEEVVVFCILAEQKSCPIQRWTGGPSHTLNLIPTYVLKRENVLVMTREFGRCFLFPRCCKTKRFTVCFPAFYEGLLPGVWLRHIDVLFASY